MKIRHEIIDQIQLDIQNLEVKKLFKINGNCNKVKVRREHENAYSIYLNGNFVTTDATWQEVFKMILTLINN